MRLYREGDRSAAICETCRDEVDTRMTYIDYTPPDTDVVVPDVLIGVCVECGNPASIPYQSAAKVVEHTRAGAGPPQETVNAMVPRALDDALGLAVATAGGRGKDVRPAMLRYYLGLVARDPDLAREVESRSKAGLAKGKASARLALQIDPRRWAEAAAAAKAAGMSKSGLLRGVAALAADDFRITPTGQPEPPKLSRAARARVEFLRGLARAL